MNKLEKTCAQRQAVGCLLVSIAAIAVVLIVVHRADGAEELTIPTSLLRSRANELQLLVQRMDSLPARFNAAHAQQLLKNVESARASLTKLRLEDRELERLRTRVDEQAVALATTADSIARHVAPSSISAAELAGHERELSSIESRLEQ